MDACRLCATPLPPGTRRCPVCGLHQDRRLSRATWWRLAAGLAAVYAGVALALAFTR